MKLKYLSVYFTLMNYKFNREVDNLINMILDKEPDLALDHLSEFRANLIVDKEHTFAIWTANKWYAYASDCDRVAPDMNVYRQLRPSRKTMIRLHEYISAKMPPKESLMKKAGLE